MSTLYNAKGEYQFSTPSLVAIYWKRRPSRPDEHGLLSYRQIEVVDPFNFPPPEHLRVKDVTVSSQPEHFLDADALNNPRAGWVEGVGYQWRHSDFHFDLEIIGKQCTSKKIIGEELKEVEGTETRPDTYIFMLKFERGGKVGRYYNNQYFTNPSERSIIGPFIWEGSYNMAAVIAQTFTRISYDVPPSARSDI